MGKIAQRRGFQGTEKIDTKVVEKLLKKLETLPCYSPKIFSCSLWGVGRLAEARLLGTGTIELEIVSDLLDKLRHLPDINFQDISNSLWGVGRFAEAQLLSTGTIKIEFISHLLQRLYNLRDCDSQAIANSLWGVGRLAEAQLLSTGTIELELVSHLLERLYSSRNCDSQAIANSLWGVGRLAEARLLGSGTIELELVSDLLQSLLDFQDCNSQHISNSLWGIGRLAELKLLGTGTIKCELVSHLLKKLHSFRDCNLQAIVNSFWGFAQLSKGGFISEKVDSNIFKDMMECIRNLSKKNIILLDVRMMLHAIELLNLNGEIDCALIDTLLKMTENCKHENSQEFSLLISRLNKSLILKKTKNPSNLKSETLRNFLYNSFSKINKDNEMEIKLKLLELITLLDEHKICTKNLPMNLAAELLRIPDLYSSCFPTKALMYLSAAAILMPYLQEQDKKSIQHSIKNWIGSAKNINFDELPLETKRRDRIVSAFQQIEPFKKLVGPLKPLSPLSRPVEKTAKRSMRFPSLENISRPEEIICHHIEHQNILELQNYLGYAGFTQQNFEGGVLKFHNRSSMSDKIIHPVSKEISKLKDERKRKLDERHVNADLAVNAFFRYNEEYLNGLIQSSTSIYFATILNACSRKKRYQLARDGVLTSLFFELPVGELNPLFGYLISPGELYRDSKAVVKLIATLKMRITREQNNKFEISKVIKMFLERAVKFHNESKNWRVVEKLRELEKQSLAKSLQTIDEWEDEEETEGEEEITSFSQKKLCKSTSVISQTIHSIPENIKSKLLVLQTHLIKRRVVVATNPIMSSVNQMDYVRENVTTFLKNNKGSQAFLLLPICLKNAEWIALEFHYSNNECERVLCYNNDDSGFVLSEMQDILNDLRMREDLNIKKNLKIDNKKEIVSMNKDSDFDSLIENIYARYSRIQSEELQIKTRKFLEKLNVYFDVQNVPGDGDCLFSSLAQQLEDSKAPTDLFNRMLYVRNLIADYLEQNPQNTLAIAQDLDELSVLRESSRGKNHKRGWGGFHHAVAFAEATNRPLYVFSRDDKELSVDGTLGLLPGSHYRYNNGASNTPIYLTYNGVDHWDWLKPKNK